MFPSPGTGALSTRLITGVALTAGLVLGSGAFAAAAPGAPGDNGTVKIHNPETPDEDNSNEPKVCDFRVAAFGFDSVQEVSWEILAHGGSNDAGTVKLDGELVLDEEGAGSTELLTLDDGHYKLEWTFEGQKGKAKHKVFKVECADEEEEGETDPTPTPTPTPTDEPETETPEDPENPEETETPEVPDDGKTPGGETEQPGDGATEEPEPTTPVTEPGQTPEDDGDDLAVTGSALAGLVAAGALAAAGGGAALYMSRKRRGEGADTEA
ncbi:hypothetical protein GCM10007079_10670 [Nocardiopsis terrae]|uniref:LPXTG-motif cell wall anchor domain-containing protein n=1 Tax=Nocardiopsis terrae TaxID=372655 RepID=A0ABR9HD49_9ACTN|nr:hypothetical protein [Nocardiopsis terrae]MBE1456720.1 hypothetical protein [Nocardiopsis terrae]GHC75420.1 hypothetical protein GCM10007079_10670 [Nocardiopsis terrae]